VKSEIMERFSPTLPAVRIRIHGNNVQLLRLRVLDELAVNIWMLEDHSHSPRSCAASQRAKSFLRFGASSNASSRYPLLAGMKIEWQSLQRDSAAT
jgi:hypothetical protein